MYGFCITLFCYVPKVGACIYYTYLLCFQFEGKLTSGLKDRHDTAEEKNKEKTAGEEQVNKYQSLLQKISAAPF